MTAKTETGHRAGFIISAEEISIDNAVVLSGQNLKAGAVVGAVAHSTASSAAQAGNTGNGVMGAVTLGVGVKVGDYVLTVVEPAANAGAFMVVDPDGIELGTGTVGVLFNRGGLSFTLADGATDFVSGDVIRITVAAGSGKLKEYNPANTDGSEVPVGVLYDDVDASAADKPAALVARMAEVNKQELVWFSGASAPQQVTALALLAASPRYIFGR
jgi:hypothetical protein